MGISIDLSDQVVIITGGTRGIGHSIVDAMLQAGARVAFCAPDQTECTYVAEEFARRYSTEKVVGIAGDLRDRRSLSGFVEAARAKWGRIDSLVSNAAEIGEHTKVEDVDCERFDQILHSNVVNNFYLCRLVLGHMAPRRSGSVILITSIAAHASMPTNIPYSSSKAAVASVARSLAAEYAGQGVRINCVSPGLIRSEASRDIWQDPDSLSRFAKERIPMLRIGEPVDVAPMCVFLSSPLAAYITGATIPVDGGRLGIGMSAGSSAHLRKVESAPKE